MKKILTLIFPVIAIYGAMNMVFSGLVAFCFISPHTEMPLIGVTDYKKNESKFYIASSFNSRVNAYDMDGSYIKRYSIFNYAKPFRFKIKSDDESIDYGIIPQNVKNVQKPNISISSGKVVYEIKYKNEPFVIKQSLLIHLLFNPAFGVGFCFVGILGTLATSAWLRNKLFIQSR